MIRLILSIFFIGMLVLPAKGTDIIFKSKSATTLNPVTLYTDSTFSKPSNVHFKSGHLLEIIGQTKEEHEDDAQNQKFKWFKVASPNGHQGWIFGDALATIIDEEDLTPSMKKFHQKNFKFDNGFENAVTWIATISGRDNFHKHDYLNPPYKEIYLVITNDRGRSAHINIGGTNARGHYSLKDAKLHDTTGDNIPEFLIQTSSFGNASELENRNFEIYSFQAGILSKVFEERMTLNYQDDVPSPALFKHIEVADCSIRIAYPDYMDCDKTTLSFDKNVIHKKMERCIEYVTYTHLWDSKKRHYKPLYKESRTSVKGNAKSFGVPVVDKPSIVGKRIQLIQQSDQFEVFKHFEKFVKQNGVTKNISYLYVRLSSGEYGYILADKVGFIDLEHSNILIDYYQKAPLKKGSWKSQKDFLKIASKGDASVYNK